MEAGCDCLHAGYRYAATHRQRRALALSSTAEKATPDDHLLSPGKYRISVYVDLDGRIADDPTLLLAADALVGHVQTEANWREGFKDAEVISFQQAAVK